MQYVLNNKMEVPPSCISSKAAIYDVQICLFKQLFAWSILRSTNVLFEVWQLWRQTKIPLQDSTTEVNW